MLAAEADLESFLQKPLGREHFRKYLQHLFVDHFYEFCEEVNKRKEKSKNRREALGTWIRVASLISL